MEILGEPWGRGGGDHSSMWGIFGWILLSYTPETLVGF